MIYPFGLINLNVNTIRQNMVRIEGLFWVIRVDHKLFDQADSFSHTVFEPDQVSHLPGARLRVGIVSVFHRSECKYSSEQLQLLMAGACRSQVPSSTCPSMNRASFKLFQ
jgi:hypothetical protein